MLGWLPRFIAASLISRTLTGSRRATPYVLSLLSTLSVAFLYVQEIVDDAEPKAQGSVHMSDMVASFASLVLCHAKCHSPAATVVCLSMAPASTYPACG